MRACGAVSLEACGIVMLTACGGDCEQGRRPLVIWPAIGRAIEAVQYVEDGTCDFLVFTDAVAPDITVHYDTRRCWRAGASRGRMSVVDEYRCGYDDIALEMAVHELLHVLGHWSHDPPVVGPTHSVMEPIAHRDWYIEQRDWKFLLANYCL